jgi:hypothetical protein
MSALILSDSHGRGMADVFEYYIPEWEIMELSLGRPTVQLRHCYMDNIVEIFEFAPQVIYLHAGHNDVSFHLQHNPFPQQPLTCLENVLSFFDLLNDQHPYSDVFYSSLFPRAVGPAFSAEKKRNYYQVAAEFQDLVMRVGELERRKVCLNKCLWIDAESGLERPEYFNVGGLHLSCAGKKAVVREWIQSAETVRAMRN